LLGTLLYGGHNRRGSINGGGRLLREPIDSTARLATRVNSPRATYDIVFIPLAFSQTHDEADGNLLSSYAHTFTRKAAQGTRLASANSAQFAAMRGLPARCWIGDFAKTVAKKILYVMKFGGTPRHIPNWGLDASAQKMLDAIRSSAPKELPCPTRRRHSCTRIMIRTLYAECAASRYTCFQLLTYVAV